MEKITIEIGKEVTVIGRFGEGEISGTVSRMNSDGSFSVRRETASGPAFLHGVVESEIKR